MMRKFSILAVLVGWLVSTSLAQDVKMEVIPYGGWANCIRLSNGVVELIITTDVGPRIMRYGYIGDQNLFKEYRDQMGKTGGDEWRIYGGHRLWHAPEGRPRSYAPDNSRIEYQWDGITLSLYQPTEPSTGFAKEMTLVLEPKGTRVTVGHTLINNNLWDIETACWAMSTMAQSGRAIIPQEPLYPYPEYLPAARPMVLWHYSDMSDKRWTWGKKYIQLRQDPKAEGQVKVGIGNTLGWAAYYLNDQVFLKRFGYDPKAKYPDFGSCNNETFTNADMLEIETLGPLVKIAPNGRTDHAEHWFLFKQRIGESEDSIDKALLPLVEKTEIYKPAQ
ncbi:hypothetical protein ACFL45_11075 [Candidatus Neomarinimicrobiota bacterium]